MIRRIHHRAIVLGLLLLVGPATLYAQRLSDLSAVDSSAVARAAWARAVAAYNASDLNTALREVTRAATAWPTQQAYVWGRASVAAEAGNLAVVREALANYAALGLGRDLRADSAFAPLVADPAFQRVVNALDAGRAPLKRSTVQAVLPDSTFWPEGMDVDARTGDFYVASIRHRTVARVTRTGHVHELWPRGRDELGAVLGVRVDTARNALWATTSGIPQQAGYSPADSAVAALLQVALPDGEIVRRWDVPVMPGGHMLGDLAVASTGDVFITDSYEPVLYRLPGGAGDLERIESSLFRSLQGIAPTPDGRIVYVADYSHGILRVDLGSGAAMRLEDAPGSTSLGCDGIVWWRGSIIAVQNGVAPARIARFVLDDGGKRIVRVEVLDRNFEIADEPTIGAVAGDSFVYVANSQWEKHRGDGTRRQDVALTAPVLLAAPLPR